MPLNIIGGKDKGSYRCNADNGVGKPLSKDVFVNVQGEYKFSALTRQLLQKVVTEDTDTKITITSIIFSWSFDKRSTTLHAQYTYYCKALGTMHAQYLFFVPLIYFYKLFFLYM